MKIDELPTDLAEVSKDDLSTAIDDGWAVLEEMAANENPSPEDVAAAKAIHEKVEKAEAAHEALVAAEAERVSDLANIRERAAERKAAAEAKAEADKAGEGAEGTEVQQPETDGGDGGTVVEGVVVEGTEPTAIAASAAAARQAASAREALRGKQAPPPAAAVVTKPKALVAAAVDNGVFEPNAKLDTDPFAKVMQIAQNRFSGMIGSSGRTSVGVATLQVPFDEAFTMKDGMSDEAMLIAYKKAGDVSRLEKPLVAGGWCAPSETLYDLCPGSTTEGLFDLPEIAVRRGGIRYTDGPDYSALYSADNVLTEAEVIAGTDKVFLEVDCPDFDDVRLDAIYMGVVSSLLTKVGYPELERDFLAEAMIAHQHRVSKYLLDNVVTAAGAAIVAGTLGSIAAGALTAVELVAEGQRAKRRWSMKQVIEVVAPHWFRIALRADLALRNGVDLLAVSDADIAAYFSVRGLRIQYVYNWQTLAEGQTEFPPNVELLVYRAGTFVAGKSPVINLNAVYDSALLKENKHIALFFEEGALVLGRCADADLVQVPIFASGRTGIANISAPQITGD